MTKASIRRTMNSSANDSATTSPGYVVDLPGGFPPVVLLHLQLHHQQVSTSFSSHGQSTERSDSAQFEALTHLLPGKALPLQVVSPADALLVSGRLGREPTRVRPDSHPPQVQPIGIPAHPHRRV